MNKVWNLKCEKCESLFIEQDMSVKKWIAFSEFVVLAVNWATTVTDKFAGFCF